MLCIRIVYLHLICSNCSDCVSLAVEQQCVLLFTYSIGTPSDDTASRPTPKKMKLSSPAVKDLVGILGMFCIRMVFAVMLGVTAQSGCWSDSVYVCSKKCTDNNQSGYMSIIRSQPSCLDWQWFLLEYWQAIKPGTETVKRNETKRNETAKRNRKPHPKYLF